MKAKTAKYEDVDAPAEEVLERGIKRLQARHPGMSRETATVHLASWS